MKLSKKALLMQVPLYAFLVLIVISNGWLGIVLAALAVLAGFGFWDLYKKVKDYGEAEDS